MDYQQKGTGFKKDVFDSRDYKTVEMFGAPAPFDWSVGFDIETELGIKLTVNDQGSSYSCVSQSKSKDREIKEFIETKNMQLMSARSIYAVRPNAPGQGMALRDACDIEQNQGVAYRQDVPDFQTEAEMDSVVGVEQAYKTKSLSYLGFTYTDDIDALAAHIRDYKGVMIGFDGLNNGTFGLEHPTWPSTASEVGWGHAVFAAKAKMVNGEKRIYFLNSWSQSCGVGGWQWFGEADLATKNSYNPFYQGRCTIDIADNLEKLMADQFLIDNEGALIQMTGVGGTGEFGTIVNGVVRTGDPAKVLATYEVRKNGKGVPAAMWALFPTNPL